ncbi:MAG: 30S ribosomal protein S13 [Candidatus Omnitrophica bacterium]|nr:30S ribosomal protein S13 [Candidatus Omnitrophota bacterium]MCM8826877.1 30S ribosomal protein S13 [Candidatus Omnitrophota bacterium]
MPRILGVDIPRNLKTRISLRYIYGIGPSNSMDILKATGVDPEKRAKDLTDDEIARIASYIQSHYKIEGELRREIAQNIRRLIEIGSYRGSRHKKGLPVRGQHTRRNARTRKGPRPRVGGIKKQS